MREKLITILVLFALSTTLLASGFQINEHGARAMGMSGAFTGLANDPSAVYFNPAGITQLMGTHFSIGATYILPNSTFTGPTPSSTESELKKQYFTPANFYATQELGADFWFGFGFNNPFGLGTEWEENWVGKYRTTKTDIRTFNFSPVIAYKISDELSAAVGITVSYADVFIARQLPVVLRTTTPPTILPDAKLELDGNSTSVGFNAGLLYKPSGELSLGLAFHSPIKYTFKGDATTTLSPNVPAPYRPVLAAALPSGAIEAPVTMPMVLTLGAAYHVSEQLLFTGDFQYNGWSSYDKLEITFNKWKDPTTQSNKSASERDFKNSFIARLGTEYVLNDCFSIRGGALYDKNPVKDERLDPLLPDADRIGINAGFSYKILSNLSVDVAYLYLIFMERKISNSMESVILPNYSSTVLNGTYKSNAHLFGLNLSYSL